MMRLVVLIIAVGTLGSSSLARQAAPVPGLSGEAIEKAIALGIAGRAAPYVFAGSRQAVLYTPLVRVALAAHTLYQRRQLVLEPAHLPPWVAAPRIWVVFSRPCPGPTEVRACLDYDWRRDATLDIALDVAPFTSATAARVEPAAIVHELEFLSIVGGPPSDESVVAAAFAADAVKPGLWATALWRFPSRDAVVSTGQITDEVLSATAGR